MSNPYLSLSRLSEIDSLADSNQLMINIPGKGPGYIPLSDFRDIYLLAEVNAQIAALTGRPGNGSFNSPITLTFTGVVGGSVSFDGTENVQATIHLADNSVPITAVEDLASTILALESQITAPAKLQSTYYSAVAAVQSSMVGYWNPDTVGLANEDGSGVILMLTSDGALEATGSNYAHQLCLGNAGTLEWRSNVVGGGWTSRTLWHDGNFNPGGYVAKGSAAVLTSLAIQSNLNTTPALLYQDNVATGSLLNDLNVRTGTATAGHVYTFGADGTFVSSGHLQAGLNLRLLAGKAVQWGDGTAALSTDGSGATLMARGGSATSPILKLSGPNAPGVVVWDALGNMTSSAALTTTGALQAATGQFIDRVVVGGVALPLALLHVVTPLGHLLVDDFDGATALSSVNPNNTAPALLNFLGSGFSFIGGSVAVHAAISAETTVTAGSMGNAITLQEDPFNIPGSVGLTSVSDVPLYVGTKNAWQMQITAEGITTSVPVNDPSDRRLKVNATKVKPMPFHRRAALYEFDRIDTGRHERSVMAQDIGKTNSYYTPSFVHPNTASKRLCKRLSVNKLGVALEQAWWASVEVDDLRALVNTLIQRLDALEAKPKKR